MEKKISEMDGPEYASFMYRGKQKPLSTFAEFNSALNGYDIFLRGKPVDKWEIFSDNITAEKILADQTKYTFKKRVGKIILNN